MSRRISCADRGPSCMDCDCELYPPPRSRPIDKRSTDSQPRCATHMRAHLAAVARAEAAVKP